MKEEPKLTIQIVGWNSSKYLADTAKALKAIPFDAAVIRYIDNGSTDNSAAIIKDIIPRAEIIELKNNKGFAPAHNIGFARCDTPFALTHDPDLQLNWEGVKKLLLEFRDEKVAAVQGKLLRASEAGVIDSAGIELTTTLNGRERGAGELDEGQYDKPATLSAVSGACGLYRMAALKQVAHQTGETPEIFDNNFFAYKEDVDLGWRLNKAGWKIVYQPVLMGRHYRTLGQRGRRPWGLRLSGLYGRLRSPRTRYSLRNYIWMLVKNMTWRDEIKYDLFITVRLAYFLVLCLLYPPLLSIWPETLRGIPNMIRKRVN